MKFVHGKQILKAFVLKWFEIKQQHFCGDSSSKRTLVRSVPILVLSLDQGPIGTAGMAFALQGHRIHVRFDKIHRCIRDYKLALGRALEEFFSRLNCIPLTFLG